LAIQRRAEVVSRHNTGASTEVAILQVFDKTLEKILGLIKVCKLFLRIRMREDIIEKQI